jgi:hypothetical protein
MAKKPSRKAAALEKSVTPKFSNKSVLTRYVSEGQRLSDRRVTLDVFRRNPGEQYLSVNLVGVESLSQICSYYREKFQKNMDRIAFCDHKVGQYNRACSEAGTQLTSAKSGGWTFIDRDGVSKAAYRSHPTQPRDGSRSSPSHSGVEFVRAFDDLAENKFARRMCAKSFQWHR